VRHLEFPQSRTEAMPLARVLFPAARFLANRVTAFGDAVAHHLLLNRIDSHAQPANVDLRQWATAAI
jgi:hypothetical protein